MMLKLTVEQLEEAGGCDEGIKAFRDMFGDGVEVDWTPEKQIEILKSPLGKHLGWAFESKLIPLWSMARARLDGANLDGARLDGANLDGARLVGANLVGANLDGANLDGAYVGETLYQTLFAEFGWEIDKNGYLKRKDTINA
jgi:hypothetical protein